MSLESDPINFCISCGVALEGSRLLCDNCRADRVQGMLRAFTRPLSLFDGASFFADVHAESWSINGFRTPLVREPTYIDLCRFIDRIRTAAQSNVLVFRGQPREYWQGDSNNETLDVSLLPASLRVLMAGNPLQGVALELDTWVHALAEEFPDFGQRRVATVTAPVDSLTNLSAITFLSYQHDFLAIAQHYGYPTSFLDVSFSIDTAIWFAMHSYLRTNDHLKSQVRTWESTTDVLLWPTLYVFALDATEIIDLRKVSPDQSESARPVRQQAAVIPFSTVSGKSGHQFPFVTVDKRGISPVVAIKLQPQFDLTGAPYLKHTHFLPGPEEDRTYAALLRRSAPRLAIYRE
jgi:hypothetical protein